MRTTQIRLLRSLLLPVIGMLVMLVPGLAQSGRFVATGSMTTPREDQGAVLLRDGRVLVVGGSGFPELSSAEFYDPATKNFTLTGSMVDGRQLCGGNQPVLMGSGKVLIAGGIAGGGGISLSEAELYDPSTGEFSSTGSMHEGRQCSTVTLLRDGRVLVTGGYGGNGYYSNTAEIFDPTSGTFSYTQGQMTTGRDAHMAALLPWGKVLIAGGDNNGGALSSAELYDPATGSFTATGAMAEPNSWPSMGLALMTSGTVLVTGPIGHPSDLYNPTSGVFTATPTLTPVGFGYTAVLLKNGSVFLSYIRSYLYVPSSKTFRAAAQLYSEYGTATLLRDGDVLVAGGAGSTGGIASAGLYMPSGK